MKKFRLLLALSIVLGLTSCEGPAGPPGFDGLDGIDGVDGVNILGKVLEIEGVNFQYDAGANLWTTGIIPFSDFNFEVFESDAILIYRYEDTVSLNDGTTADLWSPIPQNFFLDQGIIQYVFSHTFLDVEIFIDGNFNLSTVDTGFTDNQIFRIVAVPAEFSLDGIDTKDFNQVMKALSLDTQSIQKVSSF